MKRIQIKFWSWYDNLEEPFRFLFMMLVLAFPLHLSTLTDNHLWLSLFLPIVISKWWYLNKNKNDRQIKKEKR